MKRPAAVILAIVGLTFPIRNALAEQLRMIETEGTITVTLGEKPVLEYVKQQKPVPDGIEQHFTRSGYIHPIFNPAGSEVTGDFPVDHPHQHALFFAWVKTEFDGETVDFWNQAKQLGSIEHRDVIQLERDEDSVSFSVRQAYMAGTGDLAVDVIHETWTVTVHKTNGEFFLFDIESEQECVAEEPLVIEQFHYGGMALRLNAQWFDDAKQANDQDDGQIKDGDLRFITSEGNDRWEGNHTRPNWVTAHGRLDGQETSLTVFNSPQNFRSPQPVRLHPQKPYFCFAPMVIGEFQIAPNETYVSRYRFLVTSKALDEKLIAEQWREYADGTYSNNANR